MKNNKTCLITGITSGIGKATVFKLAKKDTSLILISKDEKKVNKVCEQILKINNSRYATELWMKKCENHS